MKKEENKVEEEVLSEEETDELLEDNSNEDIINIKDILSHPLNITDAGYGYTQKTMMNRLFIDDHVRRYKELIKKHGKFKYAVCKLAEGSYSVYVKIPSESTSGIFYDIIVDFKPTRKSYRTIDTHSIQVFSNSPYFVFAYANVYADRNLLIERYMHKLPKDIFDKQPEKLNPMLTVDLDKSLFNGLYFIYNTLNSISELDKLSKGVTLKDFDVFIQTHEDLMKDIQLKSKAQKIKAVQKNNKSLIHDKKTNTKKVTSTYGTEPAVNHVKKKSNSVSKVKKIKKI